MAVLPKCQGCGNEIPAGDCCGFCAPRATAAEKRAALPSVMAAVAQADELLASVMFGPPPSLEDCGYQLITCCGVIAGDGRLHRAVVYQDKDDDGYWGACQDFPDEYQPSFAYGQGETIAAALADLIEGIDAVMEVRDEDR